MLFLDKHKVSSEIEPSIANATSTKPPLDIQVEKKLFFATFESRGSIQFWIGFVLFFSVFGVLSSVALFQDSWQAWVYFVDALTGYGCIVLFVVGYIHRHRYLLATYRYGQTIQFFIKTVVIFVPLATLLAVLLTFLITGVIRDIWTIINFIVTNMILTFIFAFFIIKFFSNQYDKMQQTQATYQQKLLEQNAQLKARITPHFFFNMLNTLQSLIESDPKLASDVIDKVSRLYRQSFEEPKEVALTDEITLCEEYLAIEKYRFGDKLQVTWDLPDEDILYDMVITSLTLQMLIEKMIVTVVELTSQTIYMHIFITWEEGIVRIEMTTSLPDKVNYQTITNEAKIEQTIIRNLSVQAAQDGLQRYFGTTATINYNINKKNTIPSDIVINVRYPLVDVV